MRKILGQTVQKVRVYKTDNWNTNHRKSQTRGFIILDGGSIIKIRGSKFLIYLKDNVKSGFVGIATKAYKKIKRIIARALTTYRRNGAFSQGTEYWRSTVTMSIRRYQQQRLEIFKSKLV